ncbi:MAG: hypothetical protein HKN01_02550 [Acidimicrobiia bacterium]|nr:hypothetical protein [Acidimicrobiia bacterium]NNF68625.1 hypothetical protein [Acidimicrobiia bacterium]
MSVSRDDLEAKLREIESVVDETKEEARSITLAIVGVVVLVIFVAFLMGRRKGHKKVGGARVEVYKLK